MVANRDMEVTVRWSLFERRGDGATWKQIKAYTEDDGSLDKAVHLVQCATMENIPFTMKRKKFEAEYQLHKLL